MMDIFYDVHRMMKHLLRGNDLNRGRATRQQDGTRFLQPGMPFHYPTWGKSFSFLEVWLRCCKGFPSSTRSLYVPITHSSYHYGSSYDSIYLICLDSNLYLLCQCNYYTTSFHSLTHPRVYYKWYYHHKYRSISTTVYKIFLKLDLFSISFSQKPKDKFWVLVPVSHSYNDDDRWWK